MDVIIVHFKSGCVDLLNDFKNGTVKLHLIQLNRMLLK